MAHTKLHESKVVELNEKIVQHLNELIWLDDKNIEHAKAIQEAVLELVDYAMDQALIKDHQ